MIQKNTPSKYFKNFLATLLCTGFLSFILSGCGDEEKVEVSKAAVSQDVVVVEVKEKVEPPKVKKSAPAVPAPESLGREFMSLPGGVSINIEDSVVSFPVQLVNPDGGLEFILTRGLSKDYESILSTSLSGKSLHFAMVTVGFEASSFDRKEKHYSKKLKEQASHGSKMSIWVKFDGEAQALPLTQLIRWNGGQAVDKNSWFFAGSYFEKSQNKKVYMADDSLNLIAAYSALEMMIGPSFDVENPYDDKASQFLTVNKEIVPALGTKGIMYLCLSKDK